jgi:hypothetical protein
VSNATSYEIYYLEENTPPASNTPASLPVPGGETETASISGQPYEKTLYVWLRTVIGSFKSAWSEVISGTTYKAVSDFNLDALLSAPVKNTVPLIPAIDGEQYTGNLVWTDDEDEAGILLFDPDTVYKAVLSLRAAENYTFTGAAGFTYTGADSVSVTDNTGSTLTVTITFPATEAADNTGGIIIGGDPTAKLYMDGSPLTEGGTTIVASGTGTYTVSIQAGTYSAITWYMNGNKVAEGASSTSIVMTKRNKGNYVVNVEATPVGGSKNSGSHTFVVQ